LANLGVYKRMMFRVEDFEGVLAPWDSLGYVTVLSFAPVAFSFRFLAPLMIQLGGPKWLQLTTDHNVKSPDSNPDEA